MLSPYIHWENKEPRLHFSAKMVIPSLQYIETSLVEIVEIDQSDQALLSVLPLIV